MKKIILLSLMTVAVIGSFNSCKRKNKTTLKDIVYPITKNKLLKDSIAPFPISIKDYPLEDTFATKVEETLSPLGMNKDQIKKITPNFFEAYIDNSNSQTLDFIDDSIKVYVDAYGGNNPRLVAYKYGIKTGEKKVTFTVVDTDVKEYFNNQYMKFILKFNTKPNQGMQANTNFITSIKFIITAEIPN